ALLLAYAARDAVWPAVSVRVVPVVAKAGEPGGRGETIVQAPGWIEADPFAINVSALTDGVVREVSVLEGQRVESGQVVARLVDADARLALQRSESELGERSADLARAKAHLAAAQTAWDNPMERIRNRETAEAAVRENEGELKKLKFQIESESAKFEELKDEIRRKAQLANEKIVPEGPYARLQIRLKGQ